MSKCRTPSELLVSHAITLFPGDTVLAALQVMHRYGLGVLPVVDEVCGELIGEVTEAELCRIAERLPLLRLAEILMAKALAGTEGMTGRLDQVEEERALLSSGGGLHWLH